MLFFLSDSEDINDSSKLRYDLSLISHFSQSASSPSRSINDNISPFPSDQTLFLQNLAECARSHPVPSRSGAPYHPASSGLRLLFNCSQLRASEMQRYADARCAAPVRPPARSYPPAAPPDPAAPEPKISDSEPGFSCRSHLSNTSRSVCFRQRTLADSFLFQQRRNQVKAIPARSTRRVCSRPSTAVRYISTIPGCDEIHGLALIPLPHDRLHLPHRKPAIRVHQNPAGPLLLRSTVM